MPASLWFQPLKALSLICMENQLKQKDFALPESPGFLLETRTRREEV